MEELLRKNIKNIIVVFITVIFTGYLFSNEKYLYNGKEVNAGFLKRDYISQDKIIINEEFNFKIGLISGSIALLFLMFYWNEERNEILISKVNTFKSESKLQFDKFQKKDFKSWKSKSIWESIKHTLNPDRRIGRFEYLIKILGLNLISYFSFNIFNSFEPSANSKLIYIGTFGIIYLFVAINFLTQRMHDINISPWYLIIGACLLGIGFLANPSDFWLSSLNIGLMIFFIIIFILPGTKRENKYGPQPKF